MEFTKEQAEDLKQFLAGSYADEVLADYDTIIKVVDYKKWQRKNLTRASDHRKGNYGWESSYGEHCRKY